MSGSIEWILPSKDRHDFSREIWLDGYIMALEELLRETQGLQEGTSYRRRAGWKLHEARAMLKQVREEAALKPKGTWASVYELNDWPEEEQ